MSNVVLTIAVCLSAALAGCGAAPTRESDTLSNIRPLTTGFASVGEARLSRDERWAILRATPFAELKPQIYLAPVHDDAFGALVRITPHGTTNAGGAFSPDGSSILFSSSASENGPSDDAPLRIFRADGWQSAMAVSERDVGFDFAKHAITGRSGIAHDPAPTPDGKWIIFVTDRGRRDDTSLPITELWAMRADGSQAQQLSKTPAFYGYPVVSPDGGRLCFSVDHTSSGRLQLALADIAEDDQHFSISKERALTQNDQSNWAACWLPSGRHLIYTSSPVTRGQNGRGIPVVRPRGADELYLIRDDGYRRCQLTFSTGFDGYPWFSHDGKSLFWSSERGPGLTTQLYRADFRLPDYVKNPDWKKRG